MGFKNKNAQNHVKDWVVQGAANLPDINNPQVGDQAFVLDTCDTYVYKGDPDPLVSPTWRLYITASGAGTTEWLDLIDTPSSYSGQAGKKVVVKGTEDGLEFSLASTDDQIASEVPYTPATGANWSDPDPTEVKGALDDIAVRVILNDAKVSADGSVDTHSDVDTTTAAPNSGEVLAWNGTNWVPTVNVATDDQIASEVPFTPAGGIAATDVQAALAEVDAEKVAGPAVAVDNVVAVFDSTTGKLIKEAGASVKVQTDGALNLPIFGAARVGDVAGDVWIEDVAGLREIVVNIASVQYRVEVS